MEPDIRGSSEPPNNLEDLGARRRISAKRNVDDVYPPGHVPGGPREPPRHRVPDNEDPELMDANHAMSAAEQAYMSVKQMAKRKEVYLRNLAPEEIGEMEEAKCQE